MLPITKVSRVRAVAACPLASSVAYAPCRKSRLHSKSASLSSAEAAPAAKQAHHESRRGMRAIDGIMARRAQAGKLVAGIAAASDSDMFKDSVSIKSRVTVVGARVPC